MTGARQVGKTYSILDFASKNFEFVVSINFAMRPNLIDLFAKLKDSQELLIRISAIEGANMVPYKTVIFLDEIQLVYQRREELKNEGKIEPGSQDVITAMKALVIDGRYRFILSGSMLGTTLNDILLTPTGYMDIINMYPLDFEEYLWAKGVGEDAISYVKKCFVNKEMVDEPTNRLFLDYFREYVLIGGMPEAVTTFLKSQNLHLVQNVQEQIANTYFLDMTTYIHDNAMKLRVREIYKAIPSELNSKNKRFVSSHVIEKDYLRKKNIDDEFLWLTNAAIAIPAYNVTELILPLSLASERKTLKLFMNDIGMLDSFLFVTGIREKILSNDKVINFGAPYENVVAEELYAHGYKDAIYYYNSKKHGEVDFVIEYENEVLPIEIKSGKTNEMNVYNHTALNNVMKMYPIPFAFVFGECNVTKENDRVIQFPIYMISFL